MVAPTDVACQRDVECKQIGPQIRPNIASSYGHGEREICELSSNCASCGRGEREREILGDNKLHGSYRWQAHQW